MFKINKILIKMTKSLAFCIQFVRAAFDTLKIHQHELPVIWRIKIVFLTAVAIDLIIGWAKNVIFTTEIRF